MLSGAKLTNHGDEWVLTAVQDQDGAFDRVTGSQRDPVQVVSRMTLRTVLAVPGWCRRRGGGTAAGAGQRSLPALSQAM